MTDSFRVRYLDAATRSVIECDATAASEIELRGRMEASGNVLLTLRRKTISFNGLRAGSKRLDLAWWCRELRTLLIAGMTVIEALETMQVQSSSSPERAAIHASLLNFLRQGQSLSRAMRNAAAFPEVLVASVAASERTGTLVASLEEFLRYDDLLSRLRRQVISAGIYPAVVVGLGLLISCFLVLYVVPRFSRMYLDMRGDISFATRLLLGLSEILQAHAPLLFGVILSTLLCLVWAWRGGHVTRISCSLLTTIPFLDNQWEHLRRAKLYQALGMMFRGGYTLDEAMGVCSGLDFGKRMGVGIERARADLARGQTVASAFNAALLADETTRRLLAVGERAGGFATVLQTISDRHALDFTTFVERTSRVVEPILLVLVALLVGGVVVMMYMPIFDLANTTR